MIFSFLTHWIKGTLADTRPPRLFPQLPLVAAVQPGPEGREYLPGLAAAGLLQGVDVNNAGTARVIAGRRLSAFEKP